MKRTHEQQERWLARRTFGHTEEHEDASRPAASNDPPVGDERPRSIEPSDGELLQRIDF